MLTTEVINTCDNDLIYPNFRPTFDEVGGLAKAKNWSISVVCQVDREV